MYSFNVAFFKNFKFLVVNEYLKTIKIKKGSWTLEDDLIIPSSYSVLCDEGTEIDLINNAIIWIKNRKY